MPVFPELTYEKIEYVVSEKEVIMLNQFPPIIGTLPVLLNVLIVKLNTRILKVF